MTNSSGQGNNPSAPVAARNPPAGNTYNVPNASGNGTGKAVGKTANGGQARFYGLTRRAAAEASDAVVIGILTIFSFDEDSLIDPGSNLSYVTPYFALDFGVEPELLLEPFSVDTSASVPVVASIVYRNYVVVIKDLETIADLFKLEMVDFEMIMGMDWLSECYTNVDYRHKLVRFEFPNEPVIMWQGEIAKPREDLPGVPPDRVIDFGIDVIPDTQQSLFYRISREEHVGNLRITLKMLEENKLYARFSNCEFWLNSMDFSVHVVSSEGIKVDPQKISAVRDWPRPTSATDIRSFMDLANYYRKFVEDFSSIAAPLTKLTQKAAKFQWSEACEKSSQELKERSDFSSCFDSTLRDMPIGREIRRLASFGVRLDETENGELVGKGENTLFTVGADNDVLRLQRCLCVPDADGLRQE
ncbi:uncharacterized protein LOC132613503 [Lycium barbarum]|uniref:uncharacterized protein LOC132613503 n=1 Tax=Lycium barbarum TaxID=112863 RepID=UPI00293F6396|nr:uncharacterized protein LOC132613503 [Lycium barbarum]